MTGANLACAASQGREHPVFGLWPLRLRDDLRQAMVADGIRKVDVWTARFRLARVDFPLARTPADRYRTAEEFVAVFRHDGVYDHDGLFEEMLTPDFPHRREPVVLRMGLQEL